MYALIYKNYQVLMQDCQQVLIYEIQQAQVIIEEGQEVLVQIYESTRASRYILIEGPGPTNINLEMLSCYRGGRSFTNYRRTSRVSTSPQPTLNEGVRCWTLSHRSELRSFRNKTRPRCVEIRDSKYQRNCFLSFRVLFPQPTTIRSGYTLEVNLSEVLDVIVEPTMQAARMRSISPQFTVIKTGSHIERPALDVACDLVGSISLHRVQTHRRFRATLGTVAMTAFGKFLRKRSSGRSLQFGTRLSDENLLYKTPH